VTTLKENDGFEEKPSSVISTVTTKLFWLFSLYKSVRDRDKTDGDWQVRGYRYRPEIEHDHIHTGKEYETACRRFLTLKKVVCKPPVY
jgi:hypothetical protein